MSATVVPLRATSGPFDERAPVPPSDPEGPRRGGPGGGGSPTRDGGRFGPVVPLGVRTRRGATAFVFFDAAGRESILGARDIYSAPLVSALFGGAGARSFLESQWPHEVAMRGPDGKVMRNADGTPMMVQSGFSARDAGDDLVSSCVKMGSADDIELRRDGIWPGADGELIVHCGDKLFVGDREVPTGFRQGAALYIDAQRRPRPAAVPASVADGAELEASLRELYTFAPAQAAIGPRLVLGMVACGIYGAALDWRPHMAVYGPAGAGKSTIVRWMAVAAGAGMPASDTTEPGIRRTFSSRSGMIPLDENEAQSANQEKVLNLMRGTSGAGGAVVIRAKGDSSTEVDVFRIAGCFVLAAINPPHLSLADASRITLLVLRRGSEEDRKADLDRFEARARELHPAIVTRLILQRARFKQNVAMLRTAAIAAHATSRSADQMAALIAGWQALINDAPLSEAEARSFVSEFAGLFTTAQQAEEDDQARLVLRHLLGSVVQVDRDRRTVAVALAEGMEAIRKAARVSAGDPDLREIDDNAKRWRRVLGSIGLRWTETPHPGVYIANGAPAIEAAFRGSPWERLAWQRPLRELPDAFEPAGSLKFPGNAQARCVWVSEALLGLEDDG